MESQRKSSFRIRRLSARLAVVRLDPGSGVPPWAWIGSFGAVVRTPDELSGGCDEKAVPTEARAERGWTALQLEGPLPFSMTGVLSSLLAPLAANGVPVFVLSTYDTDCILVRADQAERAAQVLEAEGHRVVASDGRAGIGRTEPRSGRPADADEDAP